MQPTKEFAHTTAQTEGKCQQIKGSEGRQALLVRQTWAAQEALDDESSCPALKAQDPAVSYLEQGALSKSDLWKRKESVLHTPGGSIQRHLSDSLTQLVCISLRC